MFEIQAENRDLTDRDIHQPKETHKRGCYLALTFGTLLSSQGADAQRTGPFGLRPWRLCPTVRLSRTGAPKGAPMALAGLLGATQTKIHEVRGVLHARSAPPSPAGSGDPGRTELHADPRPDRPGRLRYAVLPRPLAGAAHDDEVAVAEREAQARSAASGGAQQQRPRGAEGDDRDHRVGRAAATDPVAVPGHAVPPVPVQAHACGDEPLPELGTVVAVERLACLSQQWVRQPL